MTTTHKEPGERVLTLGPKGQMMDLEVPLTEADRQGLEKRIADLSAQAFSLEEEKKRVVSPINESIKDVKAQEKQLLAQREKGTMTASVPVEVRGNTFKREKWVVRLDTNEEVPNTRAALTDEDLQILMSGVAIKGGKDERPDAPVFDLFSSRPAPKQEETPAHAASGPWKNELSGYPGWVLSEVRTKDGGAQYMLARGDAQAWGPYVWSGDKEEGYLCHPGRPEESLNEATRQSLAEAMGIEDKPGVDEEPIPAHETVAFERFLVAIEAAVEARAMALSSAPAEPLKLYEASGHPGWSAYVLSGQLFLRPPNTDSSAEPSAADKGPFMWNGVEEALETAPGFNAGDEFLQSHDKLLAELDFAIRSGKLAKPADLVEMPKAQPQAEEPQDSEPEEETPEEGPRSPAELAARQTANGARILKALLSGASSETASRIGTKTGCRKPGAALNHLLKQGLVDKGTDASSDGGDARWWLTETGKQVAAVLASPST